MRNFASETSFLNKVRQDSLIEGGKEYRELDLESCLDEVRHQIWSKAERLYALDKEREGDNWKENFTPRLFNVLEHNQQKVVVLTKRGSNNERYEKMGWGITSREVNDEGFGINVFIKKRDDEKDEEDAPVLNVPFLKEDFLERDEEQRELYNCILKSLEEAPYQEASE